MAKFVPIEEAQSETVSVMLGLPEYVDRSKVGINMEALTSLCEWAGIEMLAIRSANLGGGSDTPIVVGRNEDGTAIGGFKRTANPTSRSESANISSTSFFKDNIFLRSIIEIDLDEMSNEIREKKQSIRNPSQWIEKINDETRSQLSRIGTGHLLKPSVPDAIREVLILVTGMLFSIVINGQNLINCTSFLIGMGYGRTILKRASTIKSRLSPFSVGGVEWDRAVAFSVKMATSRIIGEIK